MGWKGHGFIGDKYKGARRNSADKTDSKAIKTNTDLIEYFSKTIVNK